MKRAEHKDVECAEALRLGAPILGLLHATGNGRPESFPPCQPEHELKNSIVERNKTLLASLREDVHSKALWDVTQKDVAAGRMTHPVPVSQVDLSKILLTPRFAVEQLKPDGSVKVRPIDDCTRSGVNGCVQPCERLVCDGVDTLVHLARLFHNQSGKCRPHFWKADIDSAFRRVPLQCDQQWAAASVFIYEGQAWASVHRALLFGATGSVHGWDRVGSALRSIARRLVFLPVCRYTDDYFSVEWAEVRRHSMEAFARIVRAILGPDAVAPAKLLFGEELEILGVDFSTSFIGIRCTPTADKRQKWLKVIESALGDNCLRAGVASKLVGGLQWASSRMFRCLGRAMLQPLWDQCRNSHSHVSRALELALRWWQAVLEQNLSQTQEWGERAQEVVHLWCDARGTPPRLAAVIYADEAFHYTDWAPDEEVLAPFFARRDAQILGLEQLALALGLSTFGHLCQGRSVQLWSDNTGAEGSARRGRARSWDHNCLAHSLWSAAVHLGCDLWVSRVPTERNISDLPSRELYSLLQWLGARWASPVLHTDFRNPQAWRAIAGVLCHASLRRP